MTQRPKPTPIELYERAVQHTGRYFAAVKPSQLNGPTPCEKWNVKQLMEHISGNLAGVINSFAAGHLTTEEHQAARGGDTGVAYEVTSRHALQIVRRPGALAKNITTPMGEMPGDQFLAVLFMDNLVHGWDLAKATRQDTTLPADLVEACYAMFSPRFPELSKTPAFKPPVPVPANSPTQVKLLAGLGRKA